MFINRIQETCSTVGTVNPHTCFSRRLTTISIMEESGSIKEGTNRSNWSNMPRLGKIHDKRSIHLFPQSIVCISIRRVQNSYFPPPRKRLWLRRFPPTVQTLMVSPPPLYPKMECWEKSPLKQVSPTVSLSPQPYYHSPQQAQTINTTCFRRKPIGTSEEGRPFTRGELVARQVVHHFFSYMSHQQRHALFTLDQECQENPTLSMNLHAEAFPWKPEDFLKTTIPTQFYKLVKFYWMLQSFVDQGIK